MTASGPEKSRSQHRVRASLEMLHNERFPHSDMEKDDEIKAPPPVTEFLPMTPVTLEQLASTQPVSKRTHDKSLKGQWKRPQSVLKSQSRKKKNPHGVREHTGLMISPLSREKLTPAGGWIRQRQRTTWVETADKFIHCRV